MTGKTFSLSEQRSLITLLFLYIIQGIVQALPYKAIPLILASKKIASYQSQATINMCVVFFCIKILWAPILDSMYIERFGKRKTYLVPLHYLLCAIYIYYSDYIDDEIYKTDIWHISVFALVSVFVASVIDVAIDGWAFTLFEEQNRVYCGVIQSLGESIGWFFSQFLFVYLQSESFCKEYLFASGRILTFNSYMIFVGIVCFMIGFYLQFWKKEEATDKQKQHRFSEIVSSLKQFWLNENLRTFCIVLLIFRLGYAPSDIVGPLYLVNHGFPKIYWNSMQLFVFPIQICFPLIVWKYLTGNNKEMFVFYYVLVLKLFDTVIFSTVCEIYVMFYKTGGGGFLMVILFLNILVQQICDQAIFILIASFIFKVGDREVGGTYFSALFCLLNAGKYLIEPISLFFMGYLQFYQINLIAFAYQIWFLCRFGTIVKDFDLKEVKYFKLNYDDMLESLIQIQEKERIKRQSSISSDGIN